MASSNYQSRRGPAGGQRAFGVAMGLLFTAVGIAFAIGAAAVVGDKSEVPVAFRVVFVLIPVGIAIVGVAFTFASARAGRATRESRPESTPRAPQKPKTPSYPPVPGDYQCDQCGAPILTSAEISPSGDVKCAHCEAWFNVRH